MRAADVAAFESRVRRDKCGAIKTCQRFLRRHLVVAEMSHQIIFEPKNSRRLDARLQAIGALEGATTRDLKACLRSPDCRRHRKVRSQAHRDEAGGQRRGPGAADRPSRWIDRSARATRAVRRRERRVGGGDTVPAIAAAAALRARGRAFLALRGPMRRTARSRRAPH
jgi:hypothetical protein